MSQKELVWLVLFWKAELWLTQVMIYSIIYVVAYDQSHRKDGIGYNVKLKAFSDMDNNCSLYTSIIATAGELLWNWKGCLSCFQVFRLPVRVSSLRKFVIAISGRSRLAPPPPHRSVSQKQRMYSNIYLPKFVLECFQILRFHNFPSEHERACRDGKN